LYRVKYLKHISATKSTICIAKGKTCQKSQDMSSIICVELFVSKGRGREKKEI